MRRGPPNSGPIFHPQKAERGHLWVRCYRIPGPMQIAGRWPKQRYLLYFFCGSHVGDSREYLVSYARLTRPPPLNDPGLSLQIPRNLEYVWNAYCSEFACSPIIWVYIFHCTSTYHPQQCRGSIFVRTSQQGPSSHITSICVPLSNTE